MLKKRTTIIGIIAIIGLAYHIYNNGGVGITDFLLLISGVGFIASQDANITTSRRRNIGSDHPDPKKEEK